MIIFVTRYINELIEELLLVIKDMDITGMGGDQSTSTAASHRCGNEVADGVGHDNHTASDKHPSLNQGTDETLAKLHHLQGETSLQSNVHQQEPSLVKPAEWARGLEAATQRRTEVLMPENLENLWTKGWDYKKREHKSISADPLLNVGSTHESESSQDPDKELSLEGEHRLEVKDKNKSYYELGLLLGKEGEPIISELKSHDFERHVEGFRGKNASDMVNRREGQVVPKLRCRVCFVGYNSYGLLEIRIQF